MKYIEIYNDLKRAILRREIAPNTLVPSEKALTIKYHVSRITAKHALNALTEDGLIYRIQGKGSFVKEHGTLKSHQILLVLPFSGNSDLGNYVSGIQSVLNDTTWKLLSITNKEFFDLSLDQLKENYAGIIYYPQNLAKEMSLLLNIYLHDFPLVLLDQTIPGAIIPSAISDNVGGGYLACQHLIKQKYQKIAFYSNTNFTNDLSGSVAERFLGYVKALRKSNITGFNPLELTETLRQLSLDKLSDYLKKQKIDAVITENDILAFKLLDLFQKNNINVPQDLAIIGFDNLPITNLTNPKLSSIGQDFNQLGASAINLLLRQINDPKLEFNKQIIVPVKLITRASTKGEN